MSSTSSEDSAVSTGSSNATDSTLTRATTTDSAEDEAEKHPFPITAGDQTSHHHNESKETHAQSFEGSKNENRDGTNATTSTNAANADPDAAQGRLLDPEDENEDMYELKASLKENIYWGITSKALEDGQKDSQKRSRQTLSYFVLVEARIKELEEQVTSLRKLSAGAADATSSNDATTSRATQDDGEAKTDGKSWSIEPSWRSLVDFIECPVTKGAVPFIEILAEPMAELPGRRTDRIFESARATRHQDNVAENSDQQDPISKSVHRIRINSSFIIEALERIMGKEWAPRATETHIRPFKVLLAYEDDLRKELLNMDEKLAEHVAPDSGLSNRVSSTEMTGPIASDARYGESDTMAEDSTREGMLEGSKHIRALLQFMDTFLHKEISVYKQFRSRKTADGSIARVSFDDLWKLFAPGDTIYDPSSHQASKVVKVRGGRPALRNEPPSALDYNKDKDKTHSGQDTTPSKFVVDCFNLAFDGLEVGPMQAEHVIRPFEGMKPVTSLPVYPIEYALELGNDKDLTGVVDLVKTPSNLVEELTRRGQEYSKLVEPTKIIHKDYEGMSLDSSPEHIDSEVIIDLDKFYQLASDPYEKPQLGLLDPQDADFRETTETCRQRCSCSDKVCTLVVESSTVLYDDRLVDGQLEEKFHSDSKDIKRWRYSNQQQLKEQYGVLFPREIYGFVLKNRKWHALDIDKIEDTKKSQEPFNSLVLPEDYKEIVRSLVEEHGPEVYDKKQTESNRTREDLVRGKGKGLVILLHGVPGVGKTSTAECVAEYTGRPLYALTCGDIGKTPREVQDSLSEAFSLAYRWNCVMLLDEADVFLAARDGTDLKRNAVVSVFLRSLEYYSGILFLTTNKVGFFDEAFKSRIHMMLYYKELNKLQTEEIWKVNLNRLRENKPTLNFDVNVLLKWVRKAYRAMEKDDNRRPWNGRQIHNAVRTAAALAAFQKKNTLTVEHLKQVEKASEEFDKYLFDTHGTDDIGRAERNMERADDKFAKLFHDKSAKSTPRKSSAKKDDKKTPRSKKKRRNPSPPPTSDEESDGGSDEDGKKSKRDKSESGSDSDSDSDA